METIKIGELNINVPSDNIDLTSEGNILLHRKEFLNVLLNNRKCRMFSMLSEVSVTMNQYLDYWIEVEGKRKKNPNPTRNPYFDGGVQNLSKKYRLVTNFDYLKSLNERLKNEDKETKEERGDVWYEHVDNNLSVVTDKKTHTKYYLQYQYCTDSILDMVYINKVDGSVIPYNELKPYLSETDNYKGQGLDKTLNVQVVNIENILEISFNNNKYILYGGFDD